MSLNNLFFLYVRNHRSLDKTFLFLHCHFCLFLFIIIARNFYSWYIILFLVEGIRSSSKYSKYYLIFVKF